MSIRNSRAPDENSGEACCLVDHSWVSPTHQLTSTNRKRCKSVLNGFPEFVIRNESYDFSETWTDQSTRDFRNIELFRIKVVRPFTRYDFSKMNSFRDFGPPGAQWHCLSGLPRGAAGDSREEKHCLQLVISPIRSN